MNLKCDAVFQGGGVKGIGFAGAVNEMEKAGYEFQNVAGTSAGAIIACLIAVGYSSREIYNIMKELDFSKLKQESFLSRICFLGKLVNITSSFGVYKTGYFKNWLDELLQKKNKRVFGDIKTIFSNQKHSYKFQAIASDLNDKSMLVLPGDLSKFGIDPDSFSISDAVVMSMSIPLFFKPYKINDMNGNTHIIVDGGILSNYPIWLLDDGTSTPPWPTFGFKFTNDSTGENQFDSTDNIIEYGKDIICTMMEANDNYHISTSKGDFKRTILIPTQINADGNSKNIRTTYFEITDSEKEALFRNGQKSAKDFLSNWNFELWKKTYR